MLEMKAGERAREFRYREVRKYETTMSSNAVRSGLRIITGNLVTSILGTHIDDETEANA